MDYNKNIRYFKSSDAHFYIGIAVLAVGAILFLLSQAFWLYLIPYQPVVGFFVAVIGAVIAWVPRSLRSSEKDIDGVITGQTADYAEAVAESLGISKSQMSGKAPILVGGYEFSAEPLYFRRGKDDRKYRTSLYTAAAMIFTKTGICISRKSFSLVENLTSENMMEFFYSDLDGASVTNEDMTLPDGTRVELVWFVLSSGGKEALRIPATQSAVLDKLCGDINYAIAQQKNASLS